ncbi:uncharacterized protein LOC133134070 isoform X2 [Conger conger]|uniref:uncharacterized protein LOC133134070 isoform X2 n=1 Tax=Conger conger TaxID=82655 RepID=UPI002A5A9899|nr:uncharacterized protein LOC133134070 isoform X2 [Conger conger]
MLSPYTSCHFYLILILINSWTDAVTITEAVNITAVRGSSVCLPCSSNLYAGATVSVKWAKTGSPGRLCDYRMVNGAVETNSIQCEHHVNATEQVSMLCLTGVKTRDAGYYTCSVTASIPPPAISRCYEVKLHIEVPPHVVIERKTTNRSGCFWLLCELNGMESAQVNFTWSRNGDGIPETSSSLHLCTPDWSEGDIFTCSISQSSNSTGLSVSITITQSGENFYPISLVLISVGTLVGSLILICALFRFCKFIQKGEAASENPVDTSVFTNCTYTMRQTQENPYLCR